MTNDCIFCKIANKELNAEIVFENDDVVAFKDLHPVAKIHILVIPKQHIPRVTDLNSENSHVLPKIFLAANEIAKKLGIDKTGFRTLFNCNEDAGQMVFHLHLHILGGEKLGSMG